MANLKEMYEKRAAIHTQMKDLTASGNYDMEAFQKMDAEFVRMSENIKAVELIEQREADQIERYNQSVSERQKVDNKEEYNEAWRAFITRGEIGMTADQKNLIFNNPDPKMRAAQQSTTVGAGGYTIPEGFSNQIALAEKYYAPIAGIARTLRTATGNDIPWPKANDTAVSAYQISEAGNHTTSATAVTFTSQTLKSFMWTSGLVQVSLQLLQDSYFDMGRLLADLFAERFGRGLNTAYTTAAGTTTIQGYITGGTDASLSNVAATALTRDNVLDLIHSIDPAYRAKPNFYITMNDSTLAAIRKIDYGTGDARPLYQVSAMAGAPDMIEGVKILINPAMASIGASAKSLAVGDFSNYIIREVAGDQLVVLRERFADTGEVGFVMLRRRDGQVVDAGMHPIKYLTHAVS